MRQSTYAGEDKLRSNQWSPFRRAMDYHQLRSDGADQLSNGDEELIGPYHESPDLERCQLGDVRDQDGLSEADADSDKDGCPEPAFPVKCRVLGHRSAKEDDDSADHSWPGTAQLAFTKS